MMGRTDIARKDILNPTYLKESVHNLKITIFFNWNYNWESLGKKFNLNTALFSGLKNSPTFFFESFLERLLTNLSLKFELTRTTHPIVLGGEAINVGFLPRTPRFHSRWFLLLMANTEFANSQMDITTLYTITTYRQILIRNLSCVSFSSNLNFFNRTKVPKTLVLINRQLILLIWQPT